MGDIVSLAMLSTFFGLIIIKTKQSKNKHKIDEIDPDFIEITNKNYNNQNASSYPPFTPPYSNNSVPSPYGQSSSYPPPNVYY